MMNHIGIYLTNEVNKDLLIDSIFSNVFLEGYIVLSGMHGELYSTTTIDRIIDEELRHDRFPITTVENPSLLSMSSGQRRKALLSYLLAQQPQYLVLDDLFSSIDMETQQFILATLNQCEKSIVLIQIFYRKQDVLPYIQAVISVDHLNRILSNESKEQFVSSHSTSQPIQ
jgi:molybdate transport system ATP-binding protein